MNNVSSLTSVMMTFKRGSDPEMSDVTKPNR